MNTNAQWIFRLGLFTIAGALSVHPSTVRAQQAAADPPMSPAVFEDVPAPDSPEGRVASGTIAVVTLHTPSADEIAAGVQTPKAVDPASGIRFEDLPRALGTRVRVLTRGQRSQRGVIEAADAHHLTLRINRHGGSASYVLAREQIERIDLD